MQTLVLKENSDEIIQKIIEEGIKVCSCVYIKPSLWLTYNHRITHLVHSLGYADKVTGTTPEQDIAQFVMECKDPYYCKDVSEFIEKIKEQQIPLTKEEFYAEIEKAMKTMSPKWRKGQKVFNAVDTSFFIAREVQFKYKIDCYHDDSQIEAFKEKAFKVYLEYNENSRAESKGTDRL